MKYEYVDMPRRGDHICYISNLEKIKSHYPAWEITKDLILIIREITEAWNNRLAQPA